MEEKNKLYQKNGNKDKYLLLPHDSVLSRHNKDSNTDTYLVKRICWADQSIVEAYTKVPAVEVKLLKWINDVTIRALFFLIDKASYYSGTFF